ncbi:MAG: ADP-glyceromanno-heptose 6-epimerase [bacterium]
MIIVTGGAGFIGSALVWKLNQMGEENIVVVDHLGENDKWKNLAGLKFVDFYNKDAFLKMIKEDEVPFDVKCIFHLGACSSTTEKNADYLIQNNYRYSLELAKFCMYRGGRFIYASSAATYGDGSFGYDDNEDKMDDLRPLNMYGFSKHFFDSWIKREKLFKKVAGLKYFNVYGPNEYHKGDMRSVVHKAFEQVSTTGKVKLFKSYLPEYKDGEQKRDFIYVKDAVDMTIYFYEHKEVNGLYNIGTGSARTWNDLVTSLFNAVGKPVNIEYIDMPEYLKAKYQCFTQADTNKLRSAGYGKPITKLEDGVTDYVKTYLLKKEYLAM